MKKVDGKITVDHVTEGLSGNADQAQLRQIVTTMYPKVQSGNSLSDGLVSDSEFGDGEAFQETRIAWVKVPTGTTKEEAQAIVDTMDKARIYKILSNEVILTAEQKSAMDNRLTSKTIEDYQKSQQVVDSENGNPIYYQGKPQYRALFFSRDGKADIDRRSGVGVGSEIATAAATQNA